MFPDHVPVMFAPSEIEFHEIKRELKVRAVGEACQRAGQRDVAVDAGGAGNRTAEETRSLPPWSSCR